MGRTVNANKGNFLGRAAASLSCFVFFTAIFLILLVPAFAEDADGRFELDADLLTYDNESEIAVAEGHVTLRGTGLVMFAERAVYDVRSGQVTAFPKSGGKVVMTAENVTMNGEVVNYNVINREGIVQGPDGTMDAFIFKGGNAVVMPADEAIRRKLISRSSVGRDGSIMTGFWSDVSITTCDFDAPHYRLVAKNIQVVLGKQIILKKPQIYFGRRMVFQYPFDYIIPLNKKEKQNMILPWLTYNSSKGAGVGLGGPLVWASGQIDFSAVYWTENIVEADVSIKQSLGRDFTLFASTNRLYNKDDEETLWRPQWGIMYANPQGWTAVLRESQRELVETEMRPGMDRRYNVWRTPEFSFTSPWIKVAPEHFVKLAGIWGSYQDNAGTPAIERIGGGARIYGEPKMGNWTIKPFYDFMYWYFDYDGDDFSQNVTDIVMGLRWNVGRLKMGTAYVRRWVHGETPLFWDNYLDREDLYQQISYAFPGHEKWEMWEVGIRAGYDFVDNRLNEVIYSLSYNKHCTTWQLYVRNSRPKDEFSIGLSFIINAYPDKALHLSEQAIYDPFERPVSDSDWNK